MKRIICVLCALSLCAPVLAHSQDLGQQVVIRRTAHGVPHVLAENFKAAGYAFGWLQLEDYGQGVAIGLLKGRGELARAFGHDSIEADFRNHMIWMDAARGFPQLDQDTRDMYEGFAAGVNAYIQQHPSEFPAWIKPDFNGIDALATDIEVPPPSAWRRVLDRLEGTPEEKPDQGSNAWAFAPSRTKSGKAILLRNPHLSWDAGYYEAQLTIPGKVDFYGDFRIGGPFLTIGGFNARLGWSTTNNEVDPDEVYALTADPALPDHVLFDGASIPLRRELVTVLFKNGDALAQETREMLSTTIGPVIGRANGKVYVWKYGGAHNFRLGQMWLRMMRAQNLSQWKDAMRMLGKPSSNFTYADADGNIFYVWYGQVPALPHKSGGDTLAIDAATSEQVWNHLVPFDSLPQLLNPRGGYIHNENDPFHFTNLNDVLPASAFPEYFPQPYLGLRSQNALQQISGKDKLSLEDVIRRKFNLNVVLAQRVKADLLSAVRATNPTGDLAGAAALLDKWDNTVAPESRGSVLFEAWWQRYQQGLGVGRTRGRAREAALFAQPWDIDHPTTTPSGLAAADRAVPALQQAIDDVKRRFGAFDVAWGDVHRVRRGSVDVPVGGCTGAIGCFRVLQYSAASDGKLVANGGDGWILAVEFGKVPRAYSVLAYGESNKPDSPYFADQAEMFARGELKPVLFLQKDVEKGTIKQYRPGVDARVSK